MQVPLLKVCWSFLFRKSRKTMSYKLVCLNHFCIFRSKNIKQILLSFLYVDIWFDVTIAENRSLNGWFYFRIFLWQTQKILYVYNFTAPYIWFKSFQKYFVMLQSKPIFVFCLFFLFFLHGLR